MEQEQKELKVSEKKRRHREFYIILVVIPAIIVLTYLESHISIISGDLPIATNIFVYGLININILLLGLLIFLILRNVVKIFLESRRKLFGSKLRTKLIASFVGLTIVPTLLLFIVVIGFVNKSIDNWFEIGVEHGLSESLELAKGFYNNTSDKMLGGATRLSTSILDKNIYPSEPTDDLEPDTEPLRAFIEEKIGESDYSTVAVYSANGERIAYAISADVNQNMVPAIAVEEVGKTLNEGARSFVQTLDVGEVVRAIVPVIKTDDLGVDQALGAVVVSYYMPMNTINRMKEISAVFEKYKQQKILKNPMKVGYFTILLIITLLIVFFGIWIGQYLAKAITVPIFELAEGTHAVASGNLDFKINVTSRDEIGSLVKSFNRMTEDLKAGKTRVEEANLTLRSANIELEERRRYNEIVMGNIPAGVISIDKLGRITSMNKVAGEILDVGQMAATGKDYKDVLRAEDIVHFKEMIKDMSEHGLESLERQMKVKHTDKLITVLVNLNALRDESGQYLGMVVVLDDLTHLLKTQRMLAWKEVARRIAHEIKNPLTPIQLSAQRLRKKYLNQFSDDSKIFDTCTKTIISEVKELKTLVNEFSSFARMPAANPTPNDLNEIAEDTMAIYKTGHKNIRFNSDFDPNIPVLEIDRDQIKRAIANLLENAVASIDGDGEIRVKTHYEQEFKLVRLEVSDTGTGIAPEDKARLFEPYFSTKKSGTGLGLAIVNDIISDHNGYIRVRDNKPHGTRFIIELPVKAGEVA